MQLRKNFNVLQDTVGVEGIYQGQEIECIVVHYAEHLQQTYNAGELQTSIWVLIHEAKFLQLDFPRYYWQFHF